MNTKDIISSLTPADLQRHIEASLGVDDKRIPVPAHTQDVCTEACTALQQPDMGRSR